MIGKDQMFQPPPPRQDISKSLPRVIRSHRLLLIIGRLIRVGHLAWCLLRDEAMARSFDLLLITHPLHVTNPHQLRTKVVACNGK